MNTDCTDSKETERIHHEGTKITKKIIDKKPSGGVGNGEMIMVEGKQWSG